MKKFNTKKDNETANEAMLAMIVIVCVIIIVNYVTM